MAHMPASGVLYPWFSLIEKSSNPTPVGVDNYLWTDSATGKLKYTSNGTTIDIGAGGGAGVGLSATDFGVVGNGIADDTAATQAAVAAAAAQNKPLYFPKGTYKLTHQTSGFGGNCCVLVPTTDNLRIYGDRAVFTYPSTTDYAFLVTTPDLSTYVKNVQFDGISFIGANDDSYLTNNKSAIYCVRNVENVTVTNCQFTQCSPVYFASDYTENGRFIFAHNRVYNGPNAVSTPYRSIIANNIFECSNKPGTRSHMIYLYGPADGTVVTGNIFRRSDDGGKFAIQIRAGTGRYNHKHGFVITNNVFYECAIGMYAGSDDSMQVSSFNISNNVFYNCQAAIQAQGIRRSVIANNVCETTWEFGSTFGGTSMISVAHSGVGLVGHTSAAEGNVVSGNVLTCAHPFFATITIGTQPTAGNTITIGTQTYTWQVAAPSSAGQVQIGANVAASALNLASEIRGGTGITPINKVLRTEQDSIVSQYSYDGSVTNKVVVASSGTFTLSQSGSAFTLTAAADNRFPSYGIEARNTQWVRVTGNTITDYATGILMYQNMSPRIDANMLNGCQIRGQGNVFSRYVGNDFVLTQTREQQSPRPWRWIIADDGFATYDQNTLAGIVSQEVAYDHLGGSAGLLPVGDGKTHAWMYYGIESFDPSFPDDPQSAPWRWADGDYIKLSNDIGVGPFTFTFKRVSPGAGQFNTPDGLLALVNATGAYTAAYAAYQSTSGGANPKTMIKFARPSAGVDNQHYVQIFRVQAAAGKDSRAVRACGVLLVDRSAGVDATDYTYMRGGSTVANRSVVWSPLASKVRGVWIQGTTSTAQALAPSAYVADIEPGVCAVVTHGTAAGTEAFFYRVNQ